MKIWLYYRNIELLSLKIANSIEYILDENDSDYFVLMSVILFCKNYWIYP
jgi:hypothetical protein